MVLRVDLNQEVFIVRKPMIIDHLSCIFKCVDPICTTEQPGETLHEDTSKAPHIVGAGDRYSKGAFRRLISGCRCYGSWVDIGPRITGVEASKTKISNLK